MRPIETVQKAKVFYNKLVEAEEKAAKIGYLSLFFETNQFARKTRFVVVGGTVVTAGYNIIPADIKTQAYQSMSDLLSLISNLF